MSSLWMGTDHLVYVKGSGLLLPFTEEYKRYRFSDIQAITVAKTSRVGVSILFVMGLLFFVGLASLVLWTSQESGFGVTLAILLSVLSVGGIACFAGLLRHLILGGTCTFDVQTSLSRERLRPVTRYPQALQIVEQLEGAIQDSQQSIGRMDQETEMNGGGVQRQRMEAYQIPMAVVASFLSFVIVGLLAAAALHLESVVLTAVILFLLLILSLILTLSLIASVRKATPESIRSVLWIQLGLMFLMTGCGAVYFLLVATRDPAYTIGIVGPLEAFTAIGSEGGLLGYLVFLGISIGMLITGCTGLLITNLWRKKIERVDEAVSADVEADEELSEEVDG